MGTTEDKSSCKPIDGGYKLEELREAGMRKKEYTGLI